MWIARTREWMHIVLNNWRDYPLREGSIWAKRYEVEQWIGMGSYGQAYRCRDIMTGKAVLVKGNKPSKGELGRKLLRRESHILQALDHPQIPSWLDYTIEGKREALVMELIDGHNLEHMIHEQGRTYTEVEALVVMKELLAPLSYLHEAGFVHRDVRIPNVMDLAGSIVLIDYGLSCGIGEQLSDHLLNGLQEAAQDDEEEGSWAAVKQRMREPEPSSDLYGLGHLFLFLMYAGYEYAEDQVELSWEEELQIRPEVRQFVRKLLMSGNETYLSASECLKELDQLLM